MKMRWLAGMVFAASAVSGANYLIEAESFPFPGEWKQVSFRGASGSGVLQGSKNAEAKGTFCFPENGSYCVWMRSYSFGENWRRATLFKGTREIGSAGDEKNPALTKYPAFTWGKLKKPQVISTGNVDLALRSDSANSRIDAILFTTDKDFIPPDGRDLPEDFPVTVLAPVDEREFRGELKLAVSTDKPAVSYRCGEEIVFTVAPLCAGKCAERGFVRWRLRSDDGLDESGDAPVTGTPVSFKTTMHRPGFVRLTAELLDSRKRPVSFTDAAGNVSRAEFDGSAGAEIENIRSLPEPDDFDEFWKAQKARLAAMSLKSEITDRGLNENGTFHRFSVSAPCPGPSYKGQAPAPMTGIYSIPVGAAPKTLKAKILLPGYGIGEQKPLMQGKEGYIYMAINAHGMEIGREPEYYRQLASRLGGYALTDGNDRENCYFNGMVLRLLRALEFLRSLPEWNGRDLEVEGGSQGGLHALWAAALDPTVSYCSAAIPWCCNVGGQTLGLMKQDAVQLSYGKGRDYYDPINMAKRIRCPVEVPRAGLGDYTCPPSGVARMYFNLKCPKKITWMQNSSHSVIPEDPETFVMEDPGTK
ncbi:MAG: acetylxylan esterase [Victivallaceae bacterium]|nr:acetylxylan esterase [Victivallaceae bacterium]